MKVGFQAPDFTLPSTNDHEWSLSKYSGQTVVLLFYPKNETLMCTKQMCSVRDNWNKYLATKAVIVGISPGTIEQHRSFINNHRLPLTLLSDVNRTVTKTYGSHRWFPIWTTRAVVVIDSKGFVRYQRIIVRAFRPTDYSVLSAIYAARADETIERYNQLSKTFWTRKSAPDL